MKRFSAGALFITAIFFLSCTNNKQPKSDTQDVSRIVSLNGSITEVLCAFGMEKNLVGVDVTSNYPESVNTIEKVGYVRSLAAEKVLALNPTLVLAFSEGMKPELKDQLSSAHVHSIIIKQEYTINGAKAFIKTLGENFNQQPKADELGNKIDEDLKKVETLPSKPKVLFIYARGAGTLMAGGDHTAPKGMIELAGGENAVSGFDDFKPLTPEALVNANPDIILLFDSGLQSLGGMDGLLAIPGVSQTNAGKNKQVIEMDGQYLAGFGPRVGEAVVFLNQKFKSAVASK